MKEQSALESGILNEGTERTGERNDDCRNRADWRLECCLEEQSGLECGMLTGGRDRTGKGNVDWKNRSYSIVEF